MVMESGFYWVCLDGKWTVGELAADDYRVWVVGSSKVYDPAVFIWGPKITPNLAQRDRIASEPDKGYGR